jgi:glycosyltransferase involved in cell wall biosynthesis
VRTVLYLHSSSGRYGADRQLELLATGLDPDRFRALVVLPEEGELAGDLRAAGVDVRVRPLAVLRRAGFSPPGLARLGAAALADAAALARLGRREQVALVHTNTSVTLGGAPAARLLRVPHVWHVREIYADFPRAWRVHRRVLARADSLPCVSEATRAPLAELAQARVLHDAVPRLVEPAPRSEARAALELPEDVFVCALLGRISSWKGQDVLARALAEPALRELGAIGLIAGEVWPGQEENERALRDLAAGLELGERLRLVGFHDDPATLLGAADVVVVPSTRPDPLPNAALEAAAAGRCVVGAAHGGIPEILEEGRTGRLVAPGEPGALARALAELAADPAARDRLAAAAREEVRRRFSRELLLERTQALYDELLAQA